MSADRPWLHEPSATILGRRVNSLKSELHTQDKPPRMPQREKDRQIVDLFCYGFNLVEIGQMYDVTREAVRQRLVKMSISPESGGKKLQYRRVVENRLRQKDKICIAKHGCTHSRYKALLEIGRDMVSRGINRQRTPVYAFRIQRGNAMRRNIAWNLNLWQWWTIWQNSGRWESRGRGNGYVMCRYEDRGAYEIGNVYIASNRQNSRDARGGLLPIGVCKTRTGSYGASISNGGKKIWLGTFRTIREAEAMHLKYIKENGIAF